MLDNLKNDVYRANILLKEYGLIKFTWGNVSGIDRSSGLVVIKPSGVAYEDMKPADMVVVDLEGKVVEGTLRPSSDTPAHLEIYKNFKSIAGIAHTHSLYATAFAQARKAIPAYGTTHADYFYGEVPCTRKLSKQEIESEYELNTGKVICDYLHGKDALQIPAILVGGHGVFSWGDCAKNAADNAAYLEYCANLAYLTLRIDKNAVPADSYLLDKHYHRKHGTNAYYGQGEHK